LAQLLALGCLLNSELMAIFKQIGQGFGTSFRSGADNIFPLPIAQIYLGKTLRFRPKQITAIKQ
jgi:hypothetical protein